MFNILDAISALGYLYLILKPIKLDSQHYFRYKFTLYAKRNIAGSYI